MDPQGELIKTRIVPIDHKLKLHFDRQFRLPSPLSLVPVFVRTDLAGYTAENGYLINPDMQNEIDHIVASL